MFEKLGFPAMCLANHATLSLYSTGRTTGLVLDSGEGATHTVPVLDGQSLTPAIVRVAPAGVDITHHIMKCLKFSTFSEREIIRDMKEKLGYLAVDFQTEIETRAKTKMKYKLPDGHVITTGKEMFVAPEGMFKPDLLDKTGDGVHEAAIKRLVTNVIL